MPVDERTFAAEIAGWVTEYLGDTPDLPFGRAAVEEHVEGTTRRHDFRLYHRHTQLPVLTGEIKMPDSSQGRHPLNADLVNDALDKAFRAGVQYCFTWNVRQFVLFDTHIQGVPFIQRQIEGPVAVAEVSVSDDVNRQSVQSAIRDYWKQFLDRFADLLAGRRSLQLAPIDQRFIGWIEGALEEPIANTSETIGELSNSDPGFKANLQSWMVTQGWEPSTNAGLERQNMDRTARLSCYILLTRLVFYQVLKRRFTQMPDLSIDHAQSSSELRSVLDARFDEAIRYSRDYETVFQPDKDDLGYSIPFLPENAPKDWGAIVDRIEELDFSSLDFDVIGQMYGQLIGPSERRRFGQFYTSPDVVDLINAFCIRNPDDTVLDPACGGGTFLVRAYYRKRALAGTSQDSPDSHEKLLNEIYGVDIAAFPAQLSTINLAVRHLSDQGNYPRVAKASFFDAQAGIPLYDIPLTGDSTRSIALQELDAVVGNPPYIRQEGISRTDKDHYKQLYATEWRGQTALSGRSDIYIHFFTHGAYLLKPGGYLGFVTSVSWLDTDYGFRLQEFLLRNFRIVAIIESEVEKWFEDARVTTAVTILQREHDPEIRDSNQVKFIQLRKPLDEIYSQALDRPLSIEGEANRQLDMDSIRDLIEETHESVNTDYWRIRVVSQQQLSEEGVALHITEDTETEDVKPKYSGGKWGQHVRGPESWFELMDKTSQHMTPLQNLANISRGFTSGKDDFYCVHDVTQHHLDRTTNPQEFQDRWGITREQTRRVRIVRDGANVEHLIESRFLELELHTLMEVKRPIVRREDPTRLVVNAPVSRARIRNTHIEAYVVYAEQQDWHTGPTIASRARVRPWYDLGLRPRQDRAQLFWPKAQQYRHVVPLNPDLLVCKDRLYDVWVTDELDPKLLWATLNSTIVALSKHQFGRGAGIEGNLDTHVIDVNAMLTPDVRLASPEASARAIAACEMMSTRNSERYLYDEFEMDDRRELDDATLEMLGIKDPAERAELRNRIYHDLTAFQKATREREIIAQRDRRQSSRTSVATPQDIADEMWEEHHQSLGLLQFPEDFVHHHSQGDWIDLPPGPVEVGQALFDQHGLLKGGTVRVGGSDGSVIDVGSMSRSQFLEAMAQCHRSGRIRVPDTTVCAEAVSSFQQYCNDLRRRCSNLAKQRTSDEGRQRAVVNALLRKALQWRK